jgi:hypothetical protein
MNPVEKSRQDAEVWKQRLASAIKNVPSPWNPTKEERARIHYLQERTQIAFRRYHQCLH